MTQAPDTGRSAHGDHEQTNPWLTHTNEVVYDNPWINVSHRTVTTPTGTKGIYGVVSFKNLAMAVVPIDDEDHTWLVGQYRYATNHYTWEVPEGGGPLDESPGDAARRELREECGLEAADLELLMTAELSNSVTDERAHIYVATGLTPVPSDPDDTEVLRLRRLPVDEAIAMVMNGEITDALSMLALYRLAIDRGWAASARNP